MRIANVVLNDFTRDNRVLKITESLSAEGHEVTVVALHKEGLDREERRNGWRVNRVKVSTAALPRGTFFGILKMAELALRVVWKWRGADTWHCNDIEAFVLGWCAQRLNPRLHLVYDCHEFESERNAKSKLERKLVGWLERRMIRRAAAVITVSPSIAAAYQERYSTYGMPNGLLVRNIPTPLVTDSAPAKPNRFRQRFDIPEGDFIALYQGAFSYNRGLETAVAAMEGLEDQGIHLVFMGYGPLQSLVDDAASRHAHVHVHPAVSYEEVLDHTLSADLGLVSVKPTCLSYLYCLPNKLFEYILAGVPVLSNDLPDCRALIESFGVGSIVAQDDAAGWRKALLDLKADGTAQFQLGLTQAAQDLSWANEVVPLVELYAGLEDGPD